MKKEAYLVPETEPFLLSIENGIMVTMSDTSSTDMNVDSEVDTDWEY